MLKIKKELLKTFCIVSMISLALLNSGTSFGNSISPTQMVQTVAEEVFQTLSAYPVSGPPEYLPKRREAIRKILDSNFDIVEMSKLALGKHWKTIAVEKQQEFARLFYWRLYSFYILRIEMYSDQTILYKNEKITDDKASVLTRVSSKQYPEFDITYRLNKTDVSWKVYDVVVEGVSLVANYRSQFNSFLSKKNSFEDLIKTLRDKAPDNAVKN